MKLFYFKLCAMLMLVLGLTELKAQEAIPMVGKVATGNGGAGSNPVSKVNYVANTKASGLLSEDRHQPFEVSVMSGTGKAKSIDIIRSAYPTNNYFTLKVDDLNNIDVSSLSYQVYDLKGKLLENKDINSNKTQISMKNLSPASYYIIVFENSYAIKIFKVIKK